MATKLLERALKSVGGVEESRRKRDEFRRDLAYVEDNREALLKDHNEEWVAVYNSEVIAHSKDYDAVLSELETKGMPIDQIPIRYLSKQKIFALYVRLWVG